MKKLFIFLFFTLFSFLYAQTKINYKLYSPEELISDFNFMVKTIEDVHPNMYTKIDSITFQQEKKIIISTLSDSLNSLD